MLRAAIFFLILSQAVEGVRIGIQKHEIREPDEESFGEGKCDNECGADSMTVEGRIFKIGEGNKVKSREDSECLSDCYKGREGETCGGGYKKMAKSKSKDKLCCKVQPCTWRVNLDDGLQGEWKQKKKGETRLFPLQDFNEGSATRNTCFCCKEPRVPWNGNLNLKCKLGYGNKGNVLGSVLAVASFSIADKVWKESCENYCKHYAGWTYAKKSFRHKVWAPASKEEEIDGPKEAAEITEELQYKVEDVKDTLASLEDHQIREEHVTLVEDLRDLLERAQAAGVEEHMDKEILEEASNTLRNLKDATIPKQVQNAMDNVDFALELDEEEDKEKLLQYIEDIQRILTLAEEYETETGKSLELLKIAEEKLDKLLKSKSLSLESE